jgi:hypothetical protein
MVEHTDWIWAAGFQTAQFLIFLGATALYSIRYTTTLKYGEAQSHLPPLMFFYVTTYGLISGHIPETAPWLALVSIIPLAVAYLLTRIWLPMEARAGELIVSTYAAIVLFHAGYMELIPDGWRELVGLFALVLLGISAMYLRPMARRHMAITLALSLVAFLGYARLTIGFDLDEVVAWRVLIPLYAAILYAAYWLVRIPEKESLVANAALYLAHLCALAGTVHLADSRLIVSVAWGVLAVATLIISMTSQDRPLGRSALLVFAAFAAKVVLFDLSGASPLVRIGCLVVLGVTMYVGGMLYQRIDKPGLELAGP